MPRHQQTCSSYYLLESLFSHHFIFCFWQTFRDPLIDAGVLTEQEAQHIFVNWNDLIICNKKFLQYVSVHCAAHFLLDWLVHGKRRICLHACVWILSACLTWNGLVRLTLYKD